MKILVDINHPAHVHYFRNFIKIMESKGYEFIIIARDQLIIEELLNFYKIAYHKRNKRPKGYISKFLYILNAVSFNIKIAAKYKPDLFLSFASFFAAFTSFVFRKPHIALDDTEHNKMNQFLYKPFSDIILTPSCFQKNLGEKQIQFNSYMELCYLHPNYFKPDSSILDLLKIKKDEKYIVLRFVSWNASHDIGQTGLTLEMKYKIIKELLKYAKVFISSEGELSDDLKQYQIKAPSERMHDALAFAALFVGEGATMASERACLGTPAIYANSLKVGYCTEEENLYDLIYGFRNSKGVLEKAIELLNTPNLKQKFQKRKQKMLRDKIDVTAFLVWFIEKYPESVKIMKDNPNYQNRFK